MLHKDFNGQIFYKQRFYSWKYNAHTEVMKVFNSTHTQLREFKMEHQLLKKMNQVTELVKRELDKPDRQTTIDYTAYNDVRDEWLE